MRMFLFLTWVCLTFGGCRGDSRKIADSAPGVSAVSAALPSQPAAATGKTASIRTRLEVYPADYQLPPYDGARFRWIASGAAQTLDGRVFVMDPDYQEKPALRGVLAHEAGAQCAIWPGGVVKCWTERNWWGQAGSKCPYKKRCDVPVAIPGLRTVTKLATNGGQTYCALTAAGEVFCWGNNDHFDCHPSNPPPCKTGEGDSRWCPYPVRIISGGARDISLGWGTCFVSKMHEVFCWGATTGLETTFGNQGRQAPLRQKGLPPIAKMLQFNDTIYLITTSGALLAKGENRWGELGDGSTTPRNEFKPIEGLGKVVQVIGASCALEEGGTVSCWGPAAYDYELRSDGQIEPLRNAPARPFRVPGISGAVEIGTPGGMICARWVDGRVYCWGSRGADELGPNEKRQFVPPVPLHATTTQGSLLRPRTPYTKPPPGKLCFDMVRAEHECDEQDAD